MQKIIVSSFMFFFLAATISAQEEKITKEAEEITDSVVVKKDNVIQKVIRYFDDTNKVKEEKKFDISFIGGPHYSNETKLGLGLLASGLYRVDRTDKTLQPSDVSIYGDITTSGFYKIGIYGNTIFPEDKYRINADVSFSSFPSKFWGVGYDAGKNDDYSKYINKEIKVHADFLARVADNLYIGAGGRFRNIQGNKFKREGWGEGLKPTVTAAGLAAIASYDSRDFILNPSKGGYVKFEYNFLPEFLGSTKTTHRYEFDARYFKSVWKGGILAMNLGGIFTQGDVPWSMLAQMGGSVRMRGYFEGRYRDKNFVQTQVELRQHVYRRSGVVLWVGAGNVFPRFDDFKFKQTLPNVGVGYRWEFKKRVNVRLDYGIGRDDSGFYFSMNEAF